MNMKSLPVLCLTLLLFHTPFLLAKGGGGRGRGGGGGGRRGGGGWFSSKKSSTSNQGSTNTNKGSKYNHASTSQGGRGGYPSQGGYPTLWQQGGAYGGYPGGYINYNPNNRLLSPRYGGSFGYGGYNSRGGSPFAQSVRAMGGYPDARSKRFGHSAVMAADDIVVVAMALRYGLGRFPRPHFHFHNRQEEYHYNHYMYRRYGACSTDTNDYSRDYKFSTPPQDYDSYMASCMRRTYLLPADNQDSETKPTKANTASLVTSNNNSGNNTTPTNSRAGGISTIAAPSAPRPLNRTGNGPGSSSSAEDDDDTVSIVEIGYPALIEQVKARKCLELYMGYSERYLVKQTGGAEGLKMSFQGLLSVIPVILMNNNILMLVQ
ncbi:prion protein b [Kryptolebias marmoratus]|uniref:Prion protein, related sequence 3 n=1 Tax=Kryptolebias marmoratus TaxID=37003 RepID=A0A3Q3EQE0_KRYMA|nr:prion protein b [Kryptolebias marmoratus]